MRPKRPRSSALQSRTGRFPCTLAQWTPATPWTLAALLAVPLVPGCATIGYDFPVAPVQQIVIGQTTQQDVQRLFGNPWRTGLEDGRTTWTYGYYKYKMFGRARSRDLVVRFNDRNVVSSYTFNSTEPEDNKKP